MTGSHAKTPPPARGRGGAGVHPDPTAETTPGQPLATPAAGHAAGRVFNVWRIGTPLVVLVSGALFAVSGANSDGTDLRPGRYIDLATLVQNESDAYESLQDRAGELKAQVDALSSSVEDVQVRRKQRLAEQLRDPANVEAISGPGITVVLSDAPIEKIESAISDPESELYPFVVHQQDLQAVVNAMWKADAEAVTIQGQRIVTTTGIRCAGSAVQLQGIPYPQPYRIQAVGDPAALIAALEANSDVTAFRSDAADPEIGVGFEADAEAEVVAPAYEGLLDISYAKPVR